MQDITVNQRADHQEILSQILLNSQDSIYVLDRGFCLTGFNRPFIEQFILAYGMIPVSGQPYPETSDKQTFLTIRKENFDKAVNGIYVEELMEYEGNSFLIRFNPLYDKRNDIIGVYIQTTNISAVIFSEKSEKRYKHVMDNINDIVFQTDADGNWTYLNNAWKRTMGYDVQECIGKPFFNYLHPGDVEHNQELFLPLIERKKEYCSHEIRYIAKDGQVRWIKVYATLLFDQLGQISGTSGTLTDITEVRRNSHRYELISNQVEDIFSLHDTDGTYLFISPAIKQVFGFQPAELIGKQLMLLAHPDDRAIIKRFFSHEIKQKNQSLIYRLSHINGSYRWVETKMKLLFDSFYNKEIVVASSHIIDDRIEAEKRMQGALDKEKQLSELKSKFVSMASHEFRTPMTSIKSNAELIGMMLEQNDDAISKKIIDFISIINEEVDRMAELINDILHLGKIESGLIFSNKKEIDVVELVNECVQQQGEQASQQKIEFEIFGEPRYILSDKTQMFHIINNLLSNAIKYSQGKKGPLVQLFFYEKELQLHIRDHGIGVPLREQEKIFDLFFRASNARDLSGTGVGLALVKQLVMLYGGEISFESIENSGSLFIVQLPYQV